MVTLPTYGPGFFRMKKRLGAAKMEAMRQDVIKRQAAAREGVLTEKGPERDRDTYTEYPKPKSKRRK